MRTLLIGLAAAAATLSPLAASSASARPYGYNNGRVAHEVRECRRELRHARNRWEYQRERRECAREISHARREARRDHRAWRYDRYGRRW
jgi:hypothetical protein